MREKWVAFLLWALKLLIKLLDWRPRELLLRWLTLQYGLLTQTKHRSRYARHKRRYRRR